jgi:hypothetical protein
LAHSFVPKDHSSPAQLPLHLVVFFVVWHDIQHLHVAVLIDGTDESEPLSSLKLPLLLAQQP